MTEITIETFIQESILGEPQKQELLELYKKNGDTPDFRERLDILLAAAIDGLTKETETVFTAIDSDVAEMDKQLADKETLLSKQLGKKLKDIDEWDIKARQAAFAEFETGMDKALTDEEKELAEYSSRKILEQ